MEYINKFLSKLGAEEMKCKAFETDYILFEYKSEEPSQKEIIDKARFSLVKKIHIYCQNEGICAGFSLALSLRRYMPETFGDISLRRCILDLFLTVAGYSASSYVGMEVALDNTKMLRKSLIIQNNNDYLRHLNDKFHAFPSVYRTQRDLFTEILKDEEYDEWLRKNDPMRR